MVENLTINTSYPSWRFLALRSRTQKARCVSGIWGFQAVPMNKASHCLQLQGCPLPPRPGQNSGRWLTWNICNGLLSRYYEFLAIEYWVLIENPFALNTLEPKPFQPNLWALAKEHITGGARGGGLPQYSIVNGGPLDPYPRTPSTLPPLSYH